MSRNIKRYRKKPVEIQAIQFDGWNWAECEDFMAGEALIHPSWMKEYDHLDIETLEGTMRCNKGDYIIRGIKGEFYPCASDVFEATYEEVEQNGFIMKLINPNELMSNLIMEFGDDNSEITKFWLDKIEDEINACQDYSKELWWNKNENDL